MLLSIVVPMYNEQEVIAETYRRLTDVCSGIEMDYEIILVDDCSRDRTMEIVRAIHAGDAHVKILSVARNGGQMVALTAGIDHALGDCILIIDADLQDPPELLPDMLAKWREGYQVIYGQRIRRKGEGVMKRCTASLYYRLLRMLSGFPIPHDTSDFRLIDRKVADALRNMPEHNRYLRGMIAWIGFRQLPIEFVREERFAGETKYTLKKMLKLAADGIFSFSSRPLALVSILGILMTVWGSLYLLGFFISVFSGIVWQDIHLIVALILFVGGLILCSNALLGAYVWRIFEDVKGRPLYYLAQKIGFEESEE